MVAVCCRLPLSWPRCSSHCSCRHLQLPAGQRTVPHWWLGHQRPWQRTDWTHQVSRQEVDQSRQKASVVADCNVILLRCCLPHKSRSTITVYNRFCCARYEMNVTAYGGGRDGWPLTLMRCDLDADICHSLSHPVTQLLIGGGTRAAWSKYMHAYRRSVHLLLVLIAGVYSHCMSLISIGTEQIPCI